VHTAPYGDDLHMSGLSCEIIPRGDSIVVTLDGGVNMATVPVFATALDRAARDGLRVVVDCSGLTHFDSTGVHILLRYSRHVPRIALVGVRRVMRSLLELFGLQTAFPMYEGLEMAISTGLSDDSDVIMAR